MTDKFKAFFELSDDINQELEREDGRTTTAIKGKLFELRKRWDDGDLAKFSNGLPMNWPDECHELFAPWRWPAVDAVFSMPTSRSERGKAV
jgi:hypothetical protein